MNLVSQTRVKETKKKKMIKKTKIGQEEDSIQCHKRGGLSQTSQGER